MSIKLGHTSCCRGAGGRFRSAPLRAGWGTHAGAAALTAGAGTAEETWKNNVIIVTELLRRWSGHLLIVGLVV